MKIFPTVYFLIPVCNNGVSALKTLDSIAGQKYKGMFFVTVVDFHSTDGSYKILLDAKADKKFSLYQVNKYVAPVSRMGYAQRLSGYFGSGITICLRPGDVLLDGALDEIARCAAKVKYNKQSTFLFDAEGNSNKLKFPRKRMRGAEFLEYVIDNNKHGIYAHRVFQVFLGGVDTCRWLGNGINSNCEFLPDISYLRMYVYVNKKLLKPAPIDYDDAFNEVMQKFAMLVSHFRAGAISGLTKTREKLLEQLSLFSLWRSFIAYKKKNYDDAKKCFELSTVIYPECERKAVWSLVKRLVLACDGKNEKLLEDIGAYFLSERED